MPTAADGPSPAGAAGLLGPGTPQAALGAAAGALATSAGDGGVLRPDQMAQLLVFTERPASWRPSIGEAVVVGPLTARRRLDDQRAAERFVGMEGVLVRDDRDGLPFGVCFDGIALQQAAAAAASAASGASQLPGPTAYFTADELLPRGCDPSGTSLAELPQPFSTAPASQLALAGALGAANLAGVLYLGGMLASVAGYPAAALGSSGPMIASLRRIYPALLAYASAFVGVPAVRYVTNRRKNKGIAQRNALRANWGEAVTDASSPRGGGGGRDGLRARLRRKLDAARQLRPRLRQLRQGEGFSTARSLDENKGVGGFGSGSSPGDTLAGDGFDDFDARLNAPKDKKP